MLRRLSVNSDLREAIRTLCEDAMVCGLEMDQIVWIIRDELRAIELEQKSEKRQGGGDV